MGTLFSDARVPSYRLPSGNNTLILKLYGKQSLSIIWARAGTNCTQQVRAISL